MADVFFHLFNKSLRSWHRSYQWHKLSVPNFPGKHEIFFPGLQNCQNRTLSGFGYLFFRQGTVKRHSDVVQVFAVDIEVAFEALLQPQVDAEREVGVRLTPGDDCGLEHVGGGRNKVAQILTR